MGAQHWVTLIVGLSAVLGVVGTLWQRQRSEERDRPQRPEHDSRAEWWRRCQWAAEQLLSPDPDKQSVGLAFLGELVDSPLVTASEAGAIKVIASAMGYGILDLSTRRWTTVTDLNESARQRAESDYDLRGSTPAVRRLAAQVIVKADRRQGREPDQWVLDVAEGRLPA